MFPEQFTCVEFYQKKKNILLYRAKDHKHQYILKSIITKDTAVRQAFYDEYESLCSLKSPSLPVYYGISEDFIYPDREGSYLTLCMEDCSGGISLDQYECTPEKLLKIIHRVGEVLLYLLEHGILYTDLNPSNVLVSREIDSPEIILLDFTFCYYFQRNPHPDYPLSFSYHLDPTLKGNQLLIQELALLMQELMLREEDSFQSSSSFFFLLQAGLRPSDHLYLKDYLSLMEKTLI